MAYKRSTGQSYHFKLHFEIYLRHFVNQSYRNHIPLHSLVMLIVNYLVPVLSAFVETVMENCGSKSESVYLIWDPLLLFLNHKFA